MANVVKDLGAVSAYALAVKHGYKGTEEEWVAAQEAARVAAETAAENAEKTLSRVGEQSDAAIEAVKGQETLSIEAVEAAGANQVDTVEAKGVEVLNSIPADYTKMVADAKMHAPCIACDVNGALVTVTDAADRGALGLVSTIAAVQSGTGDPSPDNVRPISGWDAVNITRTGRNLVSHLDYVTTQGHTGTVITEDAIDVTAPKTYDYGNIPVQLKAGVTYTLVIDWEVYGRDAASAEVTTIGYRLHPIAVSTAHMPVKANGTTRIVKTYECTEDAIGAVIVNPNFNSALPAQSRSRIMLLEGVYTADTAPAFEPGAKQTLTATLPETVYGGSLDWTTGVLTVTHHQYTLTGDEGWKSNGSTNQGQFFASKLLTGCEGINAYTATISSHYRTANAYAGKADKSMQVSGATVWLVDVGFTSADALKGYLAAQAAAGTPVTLVYQLATPYTIQLTPQQLDMLKGEDHVWSDSGDTSVVYVADTKMYIDNKFTALQNAILAQGANI